MKYDKSEINVELLQDKSILCTFRDNKDTLHKMRYIGCNKTYAKQSFIAHLEVNENIKFQSGRKSRDIIINKSHTTPVEKALIKESFKHNFITVRTRHKILEFLNKESDNTYKFRLLSYEAGIGIGAQKQWQKTEFTVVRN